MMPVQRLPRWEIAWRAAQDFQNGMYVNLGVGIPTEISPQLIPADVEVIFQSENGILGVGPVAPPSEQNVDLVNASQQRIDVLPGASYFHCADSFMMLRGGHVDLAVVGAFQVSERGDLASWNALRPGIPPAVGGAMDIAVGARNIWVLMEHTTKAGEPRLLRRCRYPLTAAGVVSRVYTDLAVVDVRPEGFMVRESLAEVPFELLQEYTAARLHRAPDWRPLIRARRAGA